MNYSPAPACAVNRLCPCSAGPNPTCPRTALAAGTPFPGHKTSRAAIDAHRNNEILNPDALLVAPCVPASPGHAGRLPGLPTGLAAAHLRAGSCCFLCGCRARHSFICYDNCVFIAALLETRCFGAQMRCLLGYGWVLLAVFLYWCLYF